MLFDGMPVVWASRLLGRPLKERVAGVDLFEHLTLSDSLGGVAGGSTAKTTCGGLCRGNASFQAIQGLVAEGAVRQCGPAFGAQLEAFLPGLGIPGAQGRGEEGRAGEEEVGRVPHVRSCYACSSIGSAYLSGP